MNRKEGQRIIWKIDVLSWVYGNTGLTITHHVWNILCIHGGSSVISTVDCRSSELYRAGGFGFPGNLEHRRENPWYR